MFDASARLSIVVAPGGHRTLGTGRGDDIVALAVPRSLVKGG